MEPYMKYGDWFIPRCENKFPTDAEAWEYKEETEEE